jgi:hypothetical protein
MFDKARRNFITYMSILGFAGFTGVSLQASTLSTTESIGHTRLDASFDPEGWL